MRNIGWEKCGPGLASRTRETAGVAFLDELLVLLRYLHGLRLRFWVALCPEDIVLPGLRVGYPLGGCSLMVGLAALITDGGEEVGIFQVEQSVHAGASCPHDGI